MGIKERLESAKGFIEVLTLFVGLIAAGFAVFATVKSYDAEHAAKEAEVNLKQAQIEIARSSELRAEHESITDRDKFVYAEVVKVFSDSDPKEIKTRKELAVSALINAFASTELKAPLLTIFVEGASSPVLKQEAQSASKFWLAEQEGMVKQLGATKAFMDFAVATATLPRFDVDIFYCESMENKVEEARWRGLAEAVGTAVNEKNVLPTHGRWRVRAVPRSVNNLPGYQIKSLQVRYSIAEGEEGAAKELATFLQAQTKQVFALHPVQQASPGYVSAFFCGGTPKP